VDEGISSIGFSACAMQAEPETTTLRTRHLPLAFVYWLAIGLAQWAGLSLLD
jgi:hypothetical protein